MTTTSTGTDAALSVENLLQPLSFTPSSSSSSPPYFHHQDAKIKIILADHNGWWAPLTHLFYSNTSRCLVSVHPESSVEEVESFYCPHCLTYFAEAEAAMSAYRCPRCCECPRCESSLLIVPTVVAACASAGGGEEEEGGGTSPQGYELQCGFCRWSSSKEIGLVEAAPEELVATLSKAEREGGGSGPLSTSISSMQEEEGRFRELLGTLRQRAVEVARDRQFRARHRPHQQHLLHLHRGQQQGQRGTQGGKGGGEDEGLVGSMARWHLADLEKKEAQQAAEKEMTSQDVKGTAVLYNIMRRKEKEGEKAKDTDTHTHTEKQHPGASSSSSFFSAEEHDPVPLTFTTLTSLDTITSAAQRRAACSQHQPTHTHTLRPLHTALLTKRSRRCRKDVEEGRPGILLKPKVNPLEGDSSNRNNVGKWWQKDSSAINVLPFVSVVCVGGFDAGGSGGGGGGGRELSFVLRLRNPLNGKVKATLVPPPEEEEGGGVPTATAQTEEEGETAAAAAAAGGGGVPYYLKHLPLALGREGKEGACYGDGVLLAQVLSDYEESASVELGAFEDEYLEDDDDEADPEALDAQALQVLRDEKQGEEKGSKTSKTVLLQSKYRAWVHLTAELQQEEEGGAGGNEEEAMGVLFFLKLTSDRSEYHGITSTSSSTTRITRSSSNNHSNREAGAPPTNNASSITVPVCLAFRRPRQRSQGDDGGK